MTLKPLAVAGTVLGAVAGAGAVALGLATLPIALPVGLVVGGTVDLLRSRHKTPQPPPAVVQALAVVAPHVPPAHLKALSAKAAAQPPAEATALSDLFAKFYSKGFPVGTPIWTIAMAPVLAFQRRANMDAQLVKAIGKVPASMRFDGKTSAALAYYTHKNYPVDPTIPLMFLPQGQGGGGGGPATGSTSASFDFSI